MGHEALNEVVINQFKVLVHKNLEVSSSDNGIILKSILKTNERSCLVSPDSDWGPPAGSHKSYI
jgi:hypothetical protein